MMVLAWPSPRQRLRQQPAASFAAGCLVIEATGHQLNFFWPQWPESSICSGPCRLADLHQVRSIGLAHVSRLGGDAWVVLDHRPDVEGDLGVLLLSTVIRWVLGLFRKETIASLHDAEMRVIPMPDSSNRLFTNPKWLWLELDLIMDDFMDNEDRAVWMVHLAHEDAEQSGRPSVRYEIPQPHNAITHARRPHRCPMLSA